MRNGKYFSEPDEFKPERWLSEQAKETNAYAYIPFSAGPRNCIGQHLSILEAMLITINIIKRYDVILNPNKQLRFKQSLLRTPADHDLVFLRKLKN